MQVSPNELLVAAPASYGDVFNNISRWELPMNLNPSDPDTLYVKYAEKTITADACGSLTTPYGLYTNVLRQHEYLITIDSIYYKMGNITILAVEFMRDTLNNYMFIANGIGYPVCIVHADKTNKVKNVEYYCGPYTGISNKPFLEQQILVYPNPSDGIITVSKTMNNNQSMNQIFVFNSVGGLVWQKNTYDTDVKIDLSGLPKGIYLIQLFDSNKLFTKKIILQ